MTTAPPSPSTDRGIDQFAATVSLRLSMLNAIASVRIALTETAGVAPTPKRVWPYTDGYVGTIATAFAGAMFRPDARPWHVPYEADWQKWVRLCTGQPARLLTLIEAEAALHGSADLDEGANA